MVPHGHLYGVVVRLGYVGYLLPYQYGVHATRASMPWNACVVLSWFKWLIVCVQRVEELSVGKVLLPMACQVGWPYVIIVVPHNDVVWF